MLTREKFDELMTEIDAQYLTNIPNLYDMVKNTTVNASQLATMEGMCSGIASNLEDVGKTEAGFAIVVRHLTYLLGQARVLPADNEIYLTAVKQIKKINVTENTNIRNGLLAFANVLLNPATPNVFMENMLRSGEISAELIDAFRNVVRCVAQDTLNAISQGKTEQEVQAAIEARISLEESRVEEEINEVDLSEFFLAMAEIEPIVIRNLINDGPWYAGLTLSETTRTNGYSDAQDAYFNAGMRYNEIVFGMSDLQRKILSTLLAANSLESLTAPHQASTNLYMSNLLVGDYRFNHSCDVDQHRNTLHQLEAIPNHEAISRIKQHYPLTDEMCEEVCVKRTGLIHAMRALVDARERVEPEFRADPAKRIAILRRFFIELGRVTVDTVYQQAQIQLPNSPALRSVLDVDTILPIALLTQGIKLSLPPRTDGYYMQVMFESTRMIFEAVHTMGLDHSENYPFDREHYSPIPPMDEASLRDFYTPQELAQMDAEAPLSDGQRQGLLQQSIFVIGTRVAHAMQQSGEDLPPQCAMQ